MLFEPVSMEAKVSSELFDLVTFEIKGSKTFTFIDKVHTEKSKAMMILTTLISEIIEGSTENIADGVVHIFTGDFPDDATTVKDVKLDKGLFNNQDKMNELYELFKSKYEKECDQSDREQLIMFMEGYNDFFSNNDVSGLNFMIRLMAAMFAATSN